MSTVSIVIPAYKGIDSETRVSLAHLIAETQCRCGDHLPWECTRGKHDVLWVPELGSSIIHWARNQIMSLALYGPTGKPGRPRSEYYFLMDSDMTAEKTYINRLMSHKKDIVAGICTVRRDPPCPTIRYWKEDTHTWYDPVEWDWHSQKLMPVDAIGTAFMLIHRRVFDRMGEAYLNCFFERATDKRKYPEANVDAYWDAQSVRRWERFRSADELDGDAKWRRKDCWWFQMFDEADPNQFGEWGEDISFCWKAKKLGFQVYADPQVKPGHIGTYSYSLDDYIELTERWKAEGRHITPTENHPQLGPSIASVQAA